MKTIEEILEDNKLIDLFMAQFEQYDSDRETILNDLTVKGHSPQKYNDDWALLMPVVKKIDLIALDLVMTDIELEDSSQFVFSSLREVNISLTHSRVVKFIKLHNNLKK